MEGEQGTPPSRNEDLNLSKLQSSRLSLMLDENKQTCDFKQYGILTSVDSALQPPFKLRNSKCFSVRSLTIKEYSSD